MKCQECKAYITTTYSANDDQFFQIGHLEWCQIGLDANK